MSASLVGSEMCIRDRLSPEVRLAALQVGLRGSVGRGCVQTRCWQCWPVSYTHLTLPTICSV
eukprot:2356087-Alexandrium_andersonii.AAC.1